MAEKKSYTLSIFNKEYIISSDEAEQDVRNAARLVDTLLREVYQALKANNEGKIAVYAALKLALELTKKERETAWSESMVESLINHISAAESSYGNPL